MIEERGFDILPWDSGLFGFAVAMLHPETVAEGRLARALHLCASEGIHLAYAFVPWGDPVRRDLAASGGGYLADRKTLFTRTLSHKEGASGGEADPFHGPGSEPILEDLALASGQFSRFRTDPRMPKGVFRDLYLTWIRRSVLGEIADVVLVVRRGGTIAGMVTVALKEDQAVIGLLAVSEAHRGQGLGGLLMQSAEQWALEHGVSSMQVATQGANAAACALYTGSGYTVIQEQAVYHFWMDHLREPPR